MTLSIKPKPTTSVDIIRSDEEALSVAHAFASRIAPRAAERDQTGALPMAEIEELSRTGLLGITVPREFGGAGVSYQTVVSVFQIIAAADPAIAQLPQSHFVFTNAVQEDGTADQKSHFFGDQLAGKRFGNAQAEKGTSSPLDLKTTVINAGKGIHKLNGTKYYCTGALVAHWIAVAAIDEAGRMVLVYVPRESPGVRVAQDWNAMGQRTTFSGSAFFDNVIVREENIVEHWRVFERPSLFHSFAQILHAAIEVGIGFNALHDTAVNIRKRKRARLGAPEIEPTQDPLLIHRLGQLKTRQHASEALLQRAAFLMDEAESNLSPKSAAEASVAVSEAKAFAEDVTIEITNELFALCGSSSTDNDLNLHRHWRNARTHSVHDANQWRYYASGNYFLNGTSPEKPVRKREAR